MCVLQNSVLLAQVWLGCSKTIRKLTVKVPQKGQQVGLISAGLVVKQLNGLVLGCVCLGLFENLSKKVHKIWCTVFFLKFIVLSLAEQLKCAADIQWFEAALALF